MQQQEVIEEQFRMRGENMTRIEAFVAAAFAFAITMLIISLDDMPKDIESFVMAIKNVPSFLASCSLIILIWYVHADWSRRYGLEDKMTVLLSSTLICIVLIFMYPLRLMMQGLFFVISDGYFPLGIELNSLYNLRIMFIFYGIGFLALTANFWALYALCLKHQKQLELNDYELNYTRRNLTDWAISTIMSGVIICIMVLIPIQYLIYVPHLFFLLFIKSYFVKRSYAQRFEQFLANQTTD